LRADRCAITRYVYAAVARLPQVSTAAAEIVRRPSLDVEIRNRRREGLLVSAEPESLAVIVTEANCPRR
jgi:hypothetical protein